MKRIIALSLALALTACAQPEHGNIRQVISHVGCPDAEFDRGSNPFMPGLEVTAQCSDGTLISWMDSNESRDDMVDFVKSMDGRVVDTGHRYFITRND